MILPLTIDFVHSFNLEAKLGWPEIVKVKFVQAGYGRQFGTREASQRRKA
jgi:hypothetical protein